MGGMGGNGFNMNDFGGEDDDEEDGDEPELEDIEPEGSDDSPTKKPTEAESGKSNKAADLDGVD